MSDPGRERRSIDWLGVAFGVVVTLLAGGAAVSLHPYSWVVALVAVVAAFVLVTQDDPFRRGAGAGMLAGVGVVALLVGACFAIISGLDI